MALAAYLPDKSILPKPPKKTAAKKDDKSANAGAAAADAGEGGENKMSKSQRKKLAKGKVRLCLCWRRRQSINMLCGCTLRASPLERTVVSTIAVSSPSPIAITGQRKEAQTAVERA
jgi:hypothetical protein